MLTDKTKEAFLEAIESFIDAKIEYALESNEEDSEGYRGSICNSTKQNLKNARENLYKSINI